MILNIEIYIILLYYIFHIVPNIFHFVSKFFIIKYTICIKQYIFLRYLINNVLMKIFWRWNWANLRSILFQLLVQKYYSNIVQFIFSWMIIIFHLIILLHIYMISIKRYFSITFLFNVHYIDLKIKLRNYQNGIIWIYQ